MELIEDSKATIRVGTNKVHIVDSVSASRGKGDEVTLRFRTLKGTTIQLRMPYSEAFELTCGLGALPQA